MGDRLQEEVYGGSTTTFTMDLNMGLTQALSDGTNSYIYGVGRIAQVNTGTEYFLGDALGSVRQLTDASGAVTYARAYDPYGVVISTTGSSQSAYSFTGEYADTYIKLNYLRSRWYDPASGRFNTKDSWQGDYNRPLSLNRWMYTEGNPVNYTDPSGHDIAYGDTFPDKRDLTDWLPRAGVYMATDPVIREIKMLNNSNDANQKLVGYYKFYNVVRDGARFDVKDKILLDSCILAFSA